MPSLPASIIFLLQPFAALFDVRTWRKVQVLLVGAMLAPGQRTVSSALQVLGLQEQRACARYHHVLSRAVWSSPAVSRVLLGLLLRHLAPATGPLVLGIDETIERRKGKQIAAKGVYRDGVRSSHGHFVKAMGLRWISLLGLVEIPWARRVWALPFLTVLAPSTRYHAVRGCRHKTVTDWARQMLCCVRRWLPVQELVVVGDRGYAALRLLAACQRMIPAITCLTRLRLDAALYAPPPPPVPGLTRVFAHMFCLCNNDSMCIYWAISLPGRPPARKNPGGLCAAGQIWYRAGTTTRPSGFTTSQDRTLGGAIIRLVST